MYNAFDCFQVWCLLESFQQKKRAYIQLLGKTKSYTAKEVTDECKVSLASVY